MAADIVTDSQPWLWTNEQLGLAAADDEVQAGALIVILNAEYQVGDTITVGFTGAALVTASLSNSVRFDCDAVGGLSGVTLGLLNSTSSQARYRVTARDEACDPGANTTVGVPLRLDFDDPILFNAQAVEAAGGVTVTWTAQVGTTPEVFDVGPEDSVDYIQTANFLVYEVDPAFDGTVDVNNDRLTLLSGSDLADLRWVPFVAPMGVFTVITPDFSHPNGQPLDVVWEGDFSWILDSDEDPDNDIQPYPSTVQVPGCSADPAVLTITATSISTECFLTIGRLILDPRFNSSLGFSNNATTLPKTTYTVSATANYADGFWGGTATGTSEFSLGAGRWVLNGFQAEVAYMPYGSNIGQIIYLVNRGLQTGDITVEIVDRNGNFNDLGVIGSLPAGTVKSVAGLIRQRILAVAPSLLANGRIAMVVTVNAPARDVQIQVAYNVGGSDRGTVNSDDNRSSTFGPLD